MFRCYEVMRKAVSGHTNEHLKLCHFGHRITIATADFNGHFSPRTNTHTNGKIDTFFEDLARVLLHFVHFLGLSVGRFLCDPNRLF